MVRMLPAAHPQAPPQAPSPRNRPTAAGWAQSSEDREQRSHPELSDRAVTGCALLPFHPQSAALRDPIRAPPAPVGTSGSLPAPPVYLQSASGWVPAMESGMTVACWTEVWVATPVSCCQAGGSRICWVPLGHACCRTEGKRSLAKGHHTPSISGGPRSAGAPHNHRGRPT